MKYKNIVFIRLFLQNNLSINILLGLKDDKGFDVVEKLKDIIQIVSDIDGSAPVVSTTYSPEIEETFVNSETSEVPQTDYDGSTTETLACCCCAEDHCDL